MSGPRELLARAWWRAHPARPARPYAVLCESERRSPDELRALQAGALRELLRAAVAVPFYRERLEVCGLAPDRVRSVEDLAALAPLERRDVQRLGVAGLSVPGARGLRLASSGSTGRPLRLLRSLEMVAWVEASDRRAREWAGIRPGERILEVTHMHARRTSPARLSQARVHCLAARLANTTTLHGDQLTDRDALRRLLDSLERRLPALVRGVSNVLYGAALALAREGRRLEAKACWSGGAHLPEYYRQAIEAAFGAPVYERYASFDTGAIAHHCPEARGFHLAAESVLVEIVVEDGRPAAPGEFGEVLVTTLRNRAMPLIRYRLGDLVEAPRDGVCPCGRGLPLLGRLIGRSNDLLRTAAGSCLAPEAVSEQMSRCQESVVEFQVTQREDLSLDVRVVQRDEPPPEPYRLSLAAALDELLGLPGAARVERVDELRLSRAGKLRHIVSHAKVGREA